MLAQRVIPALDMGSFTRFFGIVNLAIELNNMLE
jgi:hypothetical protein